MDRLLAAILGPCIYNRGKDITNHAWVEIFLYKEMFSAPFSMELMRKKTLKCDVSRSLSWWAVIRSNKYCTTWQWGGGRGAFVFTAHSIYFLRFALEIGQVSWGRFLAHNYRRLIAELCLFQELEDFQAAIKPHTHLRSNRNAKLTWGKIGLRPVPHEHFCYMKGAEVSLG